MTDQPIGENVAETLAKMNTDERNAYSLGLSHAYGDVFQVLTAALTGRMGRDAADILIAVSDNWERVRAVQVVRGVL